MSEDSKVVPFERGASITLRGQPCADVIKALEDALNLAREGKISAVGIAMVNEEDGNAVNRSSSVDFATSAWTGFELEVAIRELNYNFEKYLFEKKA